LTEVSLPKIEMPEMKLEEFLPSEEGNLKEWTSPDGKLKLKYPANWIESSEALLDQFNQKGATLTGANILFFSYQFRFEDQALAFFMVEEISPKKNLDEIVKEIEESITEKGGKMEIINSEQEDKTARLEIKIEEKEAINSRVKEKIVFTEDKAYLVVFTSFEKDWSKFEEEINEIFDSVQFTL